MYALVEYDDYRKEQSFEVITTTNDVEYAKKIAFYYTKKNIPTYNDDSIYKITTKMENQYLRPINKTIIAYKIIEVDKNKKGFKIKSTFSSVYAVIELNKIEIQNKDIAEIDTTLICDNYYDYDDKDEDEDEDKDKDEDEDKDKDDD
jgi:hypothetical protein